MSSLVPLAITYPASHWTLRLVRSVAEQIAALKSMSLLLCGIKTETCQSFGVTSVSVR